MKLPWTSLFGAAKSPCRTRTATDRFFADSKLKMPLSAPRLNGVSMLVLPYDGRWRAPHVRWRVDSRTKKQCCVIYYVFGAAAPRALTLPCRVSVTVGCAASAPALGGPASRLRLLFVSYYKYHCYRCAASPPGLRETAITSIITICITIYHQSARPP